MEKHSRKDAPPKEKALRSVQLELCNKVHLSSPSPFHRILYLIKTVLPRPVQKSFQHAFFLLTYVLLRQLQLAKTTFSCDIISKEGEMETTGDDENHFRKVRICGDLLKKFLIRPGQWIAVIRAGQKSNYVSSSHPNEAGFICQVYSRRGCLHPHDTVEDLEKIEMSSVTEYNLRKVFRLPLFVPLPKLQIRPIVTDPVIRTLNRTMPYSPIPATSVNLRRLKSSKEISSKENDILMDDHFSSCKYASVGDIILIQVGEDAFVDYDIFEINGKTEEDCLELFRMKKPFDLRIFSGDKTDQFHVPLNKFEMDRYLLPPGLQGICTKLCDGIRQALVSSYSGLKEPELWPHFLVYGPVGSGKTSLCQIATSVMGLNFYFINGANLIGDTSGHFEGQLRALGERVTNTCCPALVFIKNIHLIGKDKEGNEDKRSVIAFKEFLNGMAAVASAQREDKKSSVWSKAIFVVGCTDSTDQLLPSVGHLFLHKLQLKSVVGSAEEIESILQWHFERGDVVTVEGLDLKGWVQENCFGMQRTYGDLKALAGNSIRNASIRNSGSPSETQLEIHEEDLCFALKSVDKILKKATNSVEVPKVSWEDIGGLEDVKKELIGSVRLPLEYPHLFSSGIRRSGILLYGPPGTGKTLIAKAVATEFKLSFLSVKGPELLNMYVGQTEQNVREVFSKARDAAPSIIFFDELDALAPNRGRSGDSGGVMDRVVSQILAELDGTHSTTNVFIIGATNRPDLIDSALLRPGRFDKLLYVGINEDTHSKACVLTALTRKFLLSEDVDMSKIAELLPTGMSGADLYSLCSDAYMTAVERHITQFTEDASEETSSETQSRVDSGGVLVSSQDFKSAITRALPSLSEKDQIKYKSLQAISR